MPKDIPSPAQVRQVLKTFRKMEMSTISEQSGIPFQTLAKIRGGFVLDPRLSTVCGIFSSHAVQARIDSMPEILRPTGKPCIESSEQPSDLGGVRA